MAENFPNPGIKCTSRSKKSKDTKKEETKEIHTMTHCNQIVKVKGNFESKERRYMLHARQP